jgi:putative Holliday junction resolvase
LRCCRFADWHQPTALAAPSTAPASGLSRSRSQLEQAPGRASIHSDTRHFSVALPSSMIDGVVLGFDFGTRRIGVAIGNRLTHQARPLTTISAADNDARWKSLSALIDEWRPAELAVGIPRHPDDTPHAMTVRCERFARQLEGRYRLPVARIDERYSSAVVESEADVDAAAAAVILQQWLDDGSHDA